jgi:hypothetical protein
LRYYRTLLKSSNYNLGSNIKFCKFNYVTPQENKSLSRHQRDDVFIDIETAYKEANIELVEMTSEEYKKRREGK